MGPRAVTITLTTLVLLCRVAWPQPSEAPTDPGADPRAVGNGSTNISIAPGVAEVLDAEREARSSAAAPISLERPINPDEYVCGPGDVFELNFWGKQNFRLQIAADLEGRAFISKIGFIKVAGKTLTAVRTLVKRSVLRQYPGLGFELTLLRPRTFLVHVVENVKSPGAYQTNALERVGTTVARAGVMGSRRQILIKRTDGSQHTADLVQYELTGDMSHNPYVLDGDVIKVPPAQLSVTIYGPVHRPGTYELVKTKDLSELLELAGGFTTAVAKNLPIRLVRRNASQQATFHDLPFDKGSTPRHELRDGDEVTVQSATDLQRSVLLIGAVAGADTLDQATAVKRLPFIEGDTVRSLLERAGGVRSMGDLKRSYISRQRNDDQPVLIRLDLEALMVRRDFTADRAIEMGDSIVVPPMRHGILVEGAVARAGLYPFNPRFGIPEYVASAGGRTRTARDLDEVKIVSLDGAVRGYGTSRLLAPGDAIVVPERNFTRAEIVQLALAGAGLVLSGVAIAIAAR